MRSRLKTWEIAFFVTVAAGLLLGLGMTTRGLRLATADDVAIGRALTDPAIAFANRLRDFRTGRFYADARFSMLEWLMRLPGDALHSGIRMGAFLVAVLAAAWFMWEWRRNQRLSLLVMCVGIGFAPVSVGYQALISGPALWIGWAAIWAMGALALRPESLAGRCGIAGAFALALVVHDANAPFVIWPALLRWAAPRPGGAKSIVREFSLCGVVLVAYGMLSWFLRQAALDLAPGEIYDGAALSFNPRETAFALSVFSGSGLPGFDSWLARFSAPGAPLWLSPAAWMQRTIAGVTGWGMTGAILLGAAVWIGTLPEDRPGKRPHAFGVKGFAALLFAVFAPNLLLAFTVKYHVWSHQRMYPYYYTSMSYLAWVVLILDSAAAALASIRNFPLRRAAGAGIAAAVVFGAAAVSVANHEAVGLLRRHPFDSMVEYRRWFPLR